MTPYTFLISAAFIFTQNQALNARSPLLEGNSGDSVYADSRSASENEAAGGANHYNPDILNSGQVEVNFGPSKVDEVSQAMRFMGQSNETLSTRIDGIATIQVYDEDAKARLQQFAGTAPYWSVEFPVEILVDELGTQSYGAVINRCVDLMQNALSSQVRTSMTLYNARIIAFGSSHPGPVLPRLLISSASSDIFQCQSRR